MDTETIQVSRIHRFDSDSKLKAFVDISLAGVVVKGLRIIDGSNGLFVSMPRHKGKDGKWYDTVFPATKELRRQLNELVLEAYQQ